MLNVLSLFDGMSCGQLALKKAGIKVNKYFSSEIDKYAIKVTQANFPDTIQLGDVKAITSNQVGTIDLFIGGSPCQGFSFAGKQLNFNDPRSKLFFEYARLLKEIKPKYFLLENVRMKKESQDIISKCLGIEPIAINSNLVSAQNRYRLYWTNIPFTMPKDKGLILADILEPLEDLDPKYLAGDKLLKNYKGGDQLNPDYKSQANTVHDITKPGPTLCAGTHGYANGYIQSMDVRKKSKAIRSGGRGSYDRHEWDSVDNLHCRKLTPLECERLQTVPDRYTEEVSDTQRYKMLGNGWTVDVIAHIFGGLK